MIQIHGSFGSTYAYLYDQINNGRVTGRASISQRNLCHPKVLTLNKFGVYRRAETKKNCKTFLELKNLSWTLTVSFKNKYYCILG